MCEYFWLEGSCGRLLICIRGYTAKDFVGIFVTNNVPVSLLQATAIRKAFDSVGLTEDGKIRSWAKFNRHFAQHEQIVKAKRRAGKLSRQKWERQMAQQIAASKNGGGNEPKLVENPAPKPVQKSSPSREPYDLQLHACQGWVLFDPHKLFEGRMDEAFAFFCEWAYRFSERIPGQKVLVVDEVWKYCTPAAIPEELALVTQSGRKRGLALLVNTQLPNKINGSILNEVSEFVCFRLQLDRALEKVVEYGFDGEELKEFCRI